MKNKKILSAIIALSPCLMAASTSNYYSQAYGVYIAPEVTYGPVASDTKMTTIMSTRDDKMADCSLTYDVFAMKHYSMHQVRKPMFRVFYRAKIDLYKQVNYANGLGGWFTEKGNAALELCTVSAEFNSWGSSDFYNRIGFAVSTGAYKNTVNPYLNQRYYGVLGSQGGNSNQVSGRFDVFCNTYFDDMEVTDFGLAKLDQPKVRTQPSCTRDSAITDKVKHETYFEHEEFPCNGESLTYYGSFNLIPPDGFSTISFGLTLFAFSTIARGSSWGMCQKTATLRAPVTLNCLYD